MATQTIGGARTGATQQGDASTSARALTELTSVEQVARGLGWFSVGLGMAEILMPGVVSRCAGANGRHGALMRLLGLRELAAGAMILSGARAAGCWSRFAGDLVDLALLGGSIGTPGTNKAAAIVSTASVVGITVLDAMTAAELQESGSGEYDVRLERAVTVNKSPEECYDFWHDFERLPSFMPHIESVRPLGNNQHHWVAKGPAGVRLEWDSQSHEDPANHCISWHSLENADVDNSGSVHFDRAPGDRGTIVRLTMYYSPSSLKNGGSVIAQLLGRAPEELIARDLKRFKQVIETGEAITTDGQPAGRASGATWLDSLARG